MVSMIQPMCVVGLQQVLPPLFQAIGKVEGQLNFCNVQIRSFTRYFAFQVVNIFLVTAIAGSIFDTAAQIAENPGYAFQFLGYALPKTSSFFCYYVILKSSLGLGVELVRVVPILQSLIRATFFHNKTVRDRRKVIAGIRPIDDPGEREGEREKGREGESVVDSYDGNIPNEVYYMRPALRRQAQ